MFKKAFTLAEILIVMAIIGTVAVATIPNLMDSYQEDKDIAKLRGVFHDLEVAYAKAVTEYGSYEQWGNDYHKYIMKNLKATSCGENVGVCFSSPVVSGVTLNLGGYTYELENGVGLSLEKPSSSSSGSSRNIYVELNGGKGKREVKKHVFLFQLNNEGIIPAGKGTDRTSDGKLKFSGYGFDVTNWAITNGNMDYLRCASQLNWTNQTSCP